jgi:hypothetical protein
MRYTVSCVGMTAAAVSERSTEGSDAEPHNRVGDTDSNAVALETETVVALLRIGAGVDAEPPGDVPDDAVDSGRAADGGAAGAALALAVADRVSLSDRFGQLLSFA